MVCGLIVNVDTFMLDWIRLNDTHFQYRYEYNRSHVLTDLQRVFWNMTHDNHEWCNSSG